MLKNLNELAKNYSDVEDVKKQLRSIQSRKCRLKKQKGRDDYEELMGDILTEEQTLKELVTYFEPKKKFVTEYTAEDIAELTYDETLKAIKSIQSKKCNIQYDTDTEEYNKALDIEEMLLEHKEVVKPADDYSVKKSRIQNLVRHVENLDTMLEKKYVLEMLQNLLDNEEYMTTTK